MTNARLGALQTWSLVHWSFLSDWSLTSLVIGHSPRLLSTPHALGRWKASDRTRTCLATRFIDQGDCREHSDDRRAIRGALQPGEELRRDAGDVRAGDRIGG